MEPGRPRGYGKLTPQQEAFKDLKFGMFIHWSLFSLPTGHRNWATPVDAAKNFTAKEFDSAKLVRLAKASGAKYITFTSKHHDGFCLFSSELTDFDSCSSPAGRDFVRLMSEECEAMGMPLFIYYSLADLHHPSFAARGDPFRDYVDYYQGQIEELCTNYGRIAGFWLDPGPWHGPDLDYDITGTERIIRRLQPRALIMGRDFLESERGLPSLPGTMDQIDDHAEGVPVHLGPPSPDNPPFEVCDTLNDSWNYNRDDQNFKTSSHLIRRLVEIAGLGGNYLLNLAPTGSGRVPPEQEEIFRKIGAWLDRNGASLYGTRPIIRGPWGYGVSGKGKVFLHVLSAGDRALRIQGLKGSFDAAHLLSGEELPLVSTGSSLSVGLPRRPDPLDTIIVLERT